MPVLDARGKALLGAELEEAVLTHPGKRSTAQHCLVAWLAGVPSCCKLASPALHSMVLSSLGTELAGGTTLYRAGDAAEHMHVVVRGDVSVLIAKDKEDEEEDVEVSRLRSGQTFGEEDLLAGSKRTFTAVVTSTTALLLRVSLAEYNKALSDVHAPAFEAKVRFLASLAPLRPLREDVVRKLAPCFQEVTFRAKELLVRQGERADTMLAIKQGSCSVFVDPHHQETSAGLGEVDPKKTLQVVVIGPTAIVGDISVLAALRKRTASVQAATEVQAYKIRRSMFVRRLPPDQLKILRRLAEEKLKLTGRKIAARPPKGLLDLILHGHNLRHLAKQGHHLGHLEGDDAQEQEPPDSKHLQLVQVMRAYNNGASSNHPLPLAPSLLPPAPYSPLSHSPRPNTSPGLLTCSSTTTHGPAPRGSQPRGSGPAAGREDLPVNPFDALLRPKAGRGEGNESQAAGRREGSWGWGGEADRECGGEQQCWSHSGAAWPPGGSARSSTPGGALTGWAATPSSHSDWLQQPAACAAALACFSAPGGRQRTAAPWQGSAAGMQATVAVAHVLVSGMEPAADGEEETGGEGGGGKEREGEGGLPGVGGGGRWEEEEDRSTPARPCLPLPPRSLDSQLVSLDQHAFLNPALHKPTALRPGKSCSSQTGQGRGQGLALAQGTKRAASYALNLAFPSGLGPAGAHVPGLAAQHDADAQSPWRPLSPRRGPPVLPGTLGAGHNPGSAGPGTSGVGPSGATVGGSAAAAASLAAAASVASLGGRSTGARLSASGTFAGARLGTGPTMSPRAGTGPSPHFNYRSRPFVAAVTLKTLSQELAASRAAAAEAEEDAGWRGHSRPPSRAPCSAGPPTSSPWHPSTSTLAGPGPPAPPASTSSKPTSQPTSHLHQQQPWQQQEEGVQPTAQLLAGGPPGLVPPCDPNQEQGGETLQGGPGLGSGQGRGPGSRPPAAPPRSQPVFQSYRGRAWSSQQLGLERGVEAAPGGLGRYLTQLHLHDDVDQASRSEQATQELNAVLDALALPMMSNKASPAMRKGAVHFRPSLPRALL
ncbi:hypothetical protein V8C86DRAFT_1168574 [Haematococcus lacustris]